MRDDPLQGHAQIRIVGGKCRLGHSGRRCFGRVLDNCQPAVLLDRSQPGRTIGIPAGEDDPNRPVAVGLGNRLEKRIGGRTGVMDLRTLIEPDRSGGDHHMMIGGCHVDVAGLDESTVPTKRSWKLANNAQEVR